VTEGEEENSGGRGEEDKTEEIKEETKRGGREGGEDMKEE
jgi:hypothetical protein